jgi:septal ring factor EnvC (AmiA/AmiB activator)
VYASLFPPLTPRAPAPRPAATRSFKLAAKEALMDGMRADLVAAKRQVALAEKEAETAQRQLQQREAEIASTHRSLLKLDDVKCVAPAAAACLRSRACDGC